MWTSRSRNAAGAPPEQPDFHRYSTALSFVNCGIVFPLPIAAICLGASHIRPGMATTSNMPNKCPVCGSHNIKRGNYEDGEKSYRCENGHVFLVKKNKAA